MNININEDLQFDLWEKFRNLPSQNLLDYLYDKDSLVRNAAAKILQVRGERSTYYKAVELCKSTDESIREIGAFILGQLGTPEFPYAKESVPILTNLLENDESELVRACSAASLGHLKDPTVLQTLSEQSDDNSPQVRVNIAGALGNFKSTQVANPLLRLINDQDKEVQSWAMHSFRLVNSDEVIIDTQLFRDTLAGFIHDAHDDIRMEAICALSKLKDERVFPALLKELHRDNIYFEYFEAVADLEDLRLLKRLEELSTEWSEDLPSELNVAINKLYKIRKERN